MKVTKTCLILTVVLPLVGLHCEGQAYIDLIAPGNVDGVEGNSSVVPLNWGSPERFQQVYDASVFQGLGQSISIGVIAFRVDAFLGRNFFATVTNVELDLSTTTKAVDGLDPVFDNNVGSDKKIIFGPGNLSTMGAGGGGVVGPWSGLYDFGSNSFIYHPATGNLLLDIKVFPPGVSRRFSMLRTEWMKFQASLDMV